MNIFTDPHFWIGFGCGVLFLGLVSLVWFFVEMNRDEEDPEQETGGDVLPPILTTPFEHELTPVDPATFNRRRTDSRTGILSNDDVR